MSVRRSRAGGLVMMTGCALCLCAASVSLGQLQERDALTPVIGGLPLSTSVVVVSSRPQAVLDAVRGPWRRLGPFATGLGSETLGAWAKFAKELGYGPGEAFASLTSGGLAVVVADPVGAVTVVGAVGTGQGGQKQGLQVGAAADSTMHWAVLSVAKGEVAARVRERLKASPHAVIGGLPVFAVEGGRYALVCRSLGDGAGGAAGGDEVLALTPMEDRAFLESIVAAVEAARPDDKEAAGKTLATTRAFGRAKETAADVLILANEREADGAASKEWEVASVVACTLADRAWTFDTVTVGGVGAAGKRAALSGARLPAEASAWFDAWSPGAAVMFVSGGAELSEVSKAMSSAGGLFEPGLLGHAEGAAVYVGPSCAPKAGKGPEGERIGKGGVSVWCAVKTGRGDGLTAAIADRAGCALATVVETEWTSMWPGMAQRGDNIGEPAGPLTFAGLPDGALRVVSVKLPAGGPLGGASAADAAAPTPGVVTWFRCEAAAEGGGGGALSNWTAMGIEPVDDVDAVSGRHQELKGVLAAVALKAPERAWTVRGVVRPGNIIKALPMPMSFAVGVTGIGSVKEVRFESWDERPVGAPGRESVEGRTRVVVDWKD